MDKRELFINQWGIPIKRICASCKYKRCDNRMRLCIAGEGAVAFDGYCEKWEVDYGYENAGKGNGKVKKKSYLYYANRELIEQNRLAIERADKKHPYEKKSLADIRASYEKKNGSLYENM